MECLLTYFNTLTVPHEMVRLERMSDYRGVTVLGLGTQLRTVELTY